MIGRGKVLLISTHKSRQDGATPTTGPIYSVKDLTLDSKHPHHTPL